MPHINQCWMSTNHVTALVLHLMPKSLFKFCSKKEVKKGSCHGSHFAVTHRKELLYRQDFSISSTQQSIFFGVHDSLFVGVYTQSNRWRRLIDLFEAKLSSGTITHPPYMIDKMAAPVIAFTQWSKRKLIPPLN